MEMGILNLSVEEKIAQAVIDYQNDLNIRAGYSKSEMVRMIRPLLAIYQQGVKSGIIPIYQDTLPLSEKDKIWNYLKTESGIIGTFIPVFTTGLYLATQQGDIEAKELNPVIADIERVTKTNMVEKYTPKPITSLLNLDPFEYVERNLWKIAIIGGIGLLLYMSINKKRMEV